MFFQGLFLSVGFIQNKGVNMIKQSKPTTAKQFYTNILKLEIIQAFMGIPAEAFWRIVDTVTLKIPEFDDIRINPARHLSGLVTHFAGNSICFAKYS